MPNFLKRLELNGFKSFAQKTVIEFPEGITAIVGPNGSGKSNVVDAVRWLLGEREAKNLRGGRVDDLIFSGTPKRPRVGMAQAALHFENKNKFFPVDFAEVSVMRQVSRSGTSQYFLNKSEVLLRDLVDFFAKARLGSRGLIVVTQGNSDVFIRSTPKERREMIEEILGLREYQLKKGDAERRLKNSQINLDKVKALVEEILPHLRSLRRQTSRWEKRGALEEELKKSEEEFFGKQLGEIEEKSVNLSKKFESEKVQFAALEKEKKAAETRQAGVESAQPEERKDLNNVKIQTQSLLEKKSNLQKELGRVEVQLEITAKNVRETNNLPVHKILDAVKSAKEILRSALDGDEANFKPAIESAIGKLESVLEEKNEKKAEASIELRNELERINNNLRSIEKEITDLRDQEKRLEKGQEEFYVKFKSAVAEVEAAKDRIEQWELRNRETLFEKERLNLRKEEILRQITQAGRNAHEFAFHKPTETTVNMQELERKIFKLRGDLASIGEVDEALMREARETETRYEFLNKESIDLEKAIGDLKGLITELSEKIGGEFEKAMDKINEEFGKFFELMFGGGQAKLKIEKPEIKLKNEAIDEEAVVNIAEEEDKNQEEDNELLEKDGGVLVEVKLPRKKINSLDVLSGGERSLVGIAAIFALVSVSPPPFLVLDEIDAALDERNARRFAEMLKEFSKKTQFVVVTHNRATMEAADVLYGVTLNDDGTSKLLSLKLEQTAS